MVKKGAAVKRKVVDKKSKSSTKPKRKTRSSRKLAGSSDEENIDDLFVTREENESPTKKPANKNEKAKNAEPGWFTKKVLSCYVT